MDNNNQPINSSSGGGDSSSTNNRNNRKKKQLTFSSSTDNNVATTSAENVDSPSSSSRKNVSFGRTTSSEAVVQQQQQPSSSSSSTTVKKGSSKSISIKKTSSGGGNTFIPETPPDNVMASTSLRMRYLSDERMEGSSEDEESDYSGSDSSGTRSNNKRAASIISTRTNSQGLMDLEDSDINTISTDEKPKAPPPIKPSIRKSAKSVAYTMERLGGRSSYYDFENMGGGVPVMHRSATRSNFTGRPTMDRSMSFYPVAAANMMSPSTQAGSRHHQHHQIKRRDSIRRMKSVFDFSRDDTLHHDGRSLFYDPERGAFIGGSSEDDLLFGGGGGSGTSQDGDYSELSESAKKKLPYRLKMWMKEKYAQFVRALKLFMNYVYIFTLGVLLFLIFNLFSALSWVTVFGAEYGRILFRLSFFMLNPFNKRVFFGDFENQSTTGSGAAASGGVSGERTSLLSQPGGSTAAVGGGSSNTGVQKKERKYPLSRLVKHLFWVLLIGLPMTFIQSFIVIACWFPILPIPISKLVFNINKAMFLPSFTELTITKRVEPNSNSNSINNEEGNEEEKKEEEEPEDLSIHMIDAFTFQAFKWKLFSISVPLINLLPLVPLTIGLHYGLDDEFTSRYSMVIFGLSIVSAMPLAFIIGHCVESIVAQTSFVFGALLNATFGSIIELILYFLALYKGLQGVVMNSVSGAILAAILLTPGLSMVFGGLRFREQYFNRYAAGVSSILLFIAVVGAFLPCVYYLSFGVQQLKCGQCLNGLPYNRTKEEQDIYSNAFLNVASTGTGTNGQYYSRSTIDGVTNPLPESSWFDTAKRTFKSLYGKKYKRPNKSIHGANLKDISQKTTIGTIYGAPVEIAPHSMSMPHLNEIQNYHTLLELKAHDSIDSFSSNYTFSNMTNNATYSIRCVGCDISLEDFVHDPLYESKVRPLAFTAAIILPFAYFFSLFYSLKTHRFLMQKPPKKAFKGEPPQQSSKEEDEEVDGEENKEQQPSSTDDSKSTTGKTSIESVKDSDSLLEENEQLPIQSENESNTKTEESEEHEEGIWPIWLAILILVLCTAAYSFVAEVMTSALEPAFESIGVSTEFAGLTFIATVPSLGEFLNAIQFAWNDNVTLALEIGNVAAIQISLLQIPALVLGSFLIFEGNEHMIFSLTFPQFNLMAIFFSVLMLNYISRDGRSNYFHGLALVFVYVFIVVGFFFIYL